MKKILLIIFLILISPLLLLFLFILPSIICSYRDIPFDTSMISKATFYQVDPIFGNENYIEYLEKTKPQGYCLDAEKAKILFKDTKGVPWLAWYGGIFLGVVEMENGEKHYIAMGYWGGFFQILGTGYHRQFVGLSGEQYRELKRDFIKFYKEQDNKDILKE
ncbi:MAG: hypothetical protein PHF76_10855 [Bacteroidales bacterium]|nr:hypothetical protein [Bacteroidales bacterium]